MTDVSTLGEILIDFTPQGDSEGNPSFIANPGGAPGNVMVALSRLGKKTAFIGSVGRDQFGEMLKSTLTSNGVNTEGIVYSDIPTTLAFVHIGEGGERSFSFYRNPGADMMLSKEDVKSDIIANSKIFHVGSISMTDEPVREATLEALTLAKNHGVTISFDPNLRPALWKSLNEAKDNILAILAYADIVKLSEEELEFLTGETDIQTAAEKITAQYTIPILLVTQGAKGSYCYTNGVLEYVPGYTVYAIDTTGCGDAFFAGALFKLLELDLIGKELTKKEKRQILQFGNAMGAIVATEKGAIPAMPTIDMVEKYISKK
ncbi:carbohydrate kinase family protein [Ornithinibacillus californiensis]|uniref:carbohydrate kinase family protein n=1 Tax=Ornithinibacillus californiensis TaxID=161536 RepID=UPI00064DD591|nr:carbohydrate kinase [Ornithinibacillus californiensis]